MSATNLIYVLSRESGEYSDYIHIILGIFSTLDKAVIALLEKYPKSDFCDNVADDIVHKYDTGTNEWNIDVSHFKKYNGDLDDENSHSTTSTDATISDYVIRSFNLNDNTYYANYKYMQTVKGTKKDVLRISNDYILTRYNDSSNIDNALGPYTDTDVLALTSFRNMLLELSLLPQEPSTEEE